MFEWLKRNGVRFALILIRLFVKDHTVVGKIGKAIDEAEENKK
jgi:hypothetical protein